MKKPQFRFIIFIGLLAVLFGLGKYFSIDAAKIDDFLDKVPIGWACLAFIFIYVVGTFLIWYLKDPLKVVGAIVFGAFLSTALIYVAEIINAYLFFNVSKFLGKDFVEKSLRGRFKGFYEKLEDFSFGWMFLLRAIPFIPYRVLDLSFGLSKVRFRKYFLIVLLASPPRIFWIQYPLASVKSLSIEKMTEYFLNNPLVFTWYFLYTVFACIVVFIMKGKFSKKKQDAG
ncbi:MAG: TVP38/TMEM64 family protein [Candidatus Omnitrophica bacterium]|nr:TVP38/TMEM64 family protein [Candidatus Omnitrophota bacterium]